MTYTTKSQSGLLAMVRFVCPAVTHAQSRLGIKACSVLVLCSGLMVICSGLVVICSGLVGTCSCLVVICSGFVVVCSVFGGYM